MAVLFRSKLPSESVYIPIEHRFISFASGEYLTDNAEEIAVLSAEYERIKDEPVVDEVAQVDDKPKRGRKPKADNDAK